MGQDSEPATGDAVASSHNAFGLTISPGSPSESQLRELSPSALAYVGDAVYELFIRGHYLLPPQRIQTYHQQVVSQVRAEQQAHHLDALIPHLTPAETEIVRRGRNVASNRRQRASAAIYQKATSLETLVGYLYLTNLQRLGELLNQLELERLG